MKKDIADNLKKFHVVDSRLVAFGVCVLIALMLWFLNALNKQYTTELTFPISYADMPKGKYLAEELPSELTMEVSAKGFALIGNSLGNSFMLVTIYVNQFSNGRLEKPKENSFVLKLDDVKDKISSQLNSSIRVLNIRPQEIEFKFSPAFSKKVPVVPNIQVTLDKRYMLKDDASSLPDSVIISGPKSAIDTIHAIQTIMQKTKELSKNASYTALLDVPPMIKTNVSEVTLNVELERFTEAQRQIPIKIKNLPKGVKIILFPEYVTVNYNVGLSRFDMTSNEEFAFYVNYEDCANTAELKVENTKQPDDIKDMKYYPHKVEFIIEAQ